MEEMDAAHHHNQVPGKGAPDVRYRIQQASVAAAVDQL
jgi:hypothetical protein